MDGIDKSLQWVRDEALNMEFGVLTLSVVIHAGNVARIEKTITHKLQIENKTKTK